MQFSRRYVLDYHLVYAGGLPARGANRVSSMPSTLPREAARLRWDGPAMERTPAIAPRPKARLRMPTSVLVIYFRLLLMFRLTLSGRLRRVSTGPSPE